MDVDKKPQRLMSKPSLGQVHFGPGAFFRAFNALYNQDLMELALSSRADEALQAMDWGIAAVSLQSYKTRDQLIEQDWVYSAVSCQDAGASVRRVESVIGCLVAKEDPAAVLDLLADPTVKLVTLTITEKGYAQRPSDGELMIEHPDISHDLENSSLPRSAIGFLTYGLARRQDLGLRPFTVLSCDNLPENGKRLKAMVLTFARTVSPDLADWIEAETRFPSSMVDRITPAIKPEDLTAFEQRNGYRDRAMVVHEPFCQWVIEDNFVDDCKPRWDRVGAQFVKDVAPFERMKLRCLNGTHSCLAYLGYLAGFETIAETVVDEDFALLCKKMWHEEILPSLPAPEGQDLQAYCDQLAQRYANPFIAHKTGQIAMDGSQKVPQRLLSTLVDNLNAGLPIACLSLAVAGWMAYVRGVDEQGKAIDVRDPFAKDLKIALELAQTAKQAVTAILSFEAIFPARLAANKVFQTQLEADYEALLCHGAKVTVRKRVRAD